MGGEIMQWKESLKFDKAYVTSLWAQWSIITCVDTKMKCQASRDHSIRKMKMEERRTYFAFFSSLPHLRNKRIVAKSYFNFRRDYGLALFLSFFLREPSKRIRQWALALDERAGISVTTSWTFEFCFLVILFQPFSPSLSLARLPNLKGQWDGLV